MKTILHFSLTLLFIFLCFSCTTSSFDPIEKRTVHLDLQWTLVRDSVREVANVKAFSLLSHAAGELWVADPLYEGSLPEEPFWEPSLPLFISTILPYSGEQQQWISLPPRNFDVELWVDEKKIHTSSTRSVTEHILLPTLEKDSAMLFIRILPHSIQPISSSGLPDYFDLRMYGPLYCSQGYFPITGNSFAAPFSDTLHIVLESIDPDIKEVPLIGWKSGTTKETTISVVPGKEKYQIPLNSFFSQADSIQIGGLLISPLSSHTVWDLKDPGPSLYYPLSDPLQTLSVFEFEKDMEELKLLGLQDLIMKEDALLLPNEYLYILDSLQLRFWVEYPWVEDISLDHGLQILERFGSITTFGGIRFKVSKETNKITEELQKEWDALAFPHTVQWSILEDRGKSDFHPSFPVINNLPVWIENPLNAATHPYWNQCISQNSWESLSSDILETFGLPFDGFGMFYFSDILQHRALEKSLLEDSSRATPFYLRRFFPGMHHALIDPFGTRRAAYFAYRKSISAPFTVKRHNTHWEISGKENNRSSVVYTLDPQYSIDSMQVIDTLVGSASVLCPSPTPSLLLILEDVHSKNIFRFWEPDPTIELDIPNFGFKLNAQSAIKSLEIVSETFLPYTDWENQGTGKFARNFEHLLIGDTLTFPMEFLPSASSENENQIEVYTYYLNIK